MEEGVQAPDWDSDETVIEGSVTESDLEEKELPWRRLLFDQDTSLKSEFSLHPDTRGMCKGMPSPEIQLGFKLREDLQEQMNKNKMMPILSEDTILQSQDETERNQALLQTRKNCSMFIGSFRQSGLSLNHQNIEGPEAESPEVLPHIEKELSEGRDSPEVSLLSGTAITVSDTVAVKETSLIEPEKILAAPNTFFEPRKEVTLTMNSEETKDEESSLETFVSALERLLTSPESTQEEKLFELASDFDRKELMNPLSDSLSCISIPLNAWSACHRDLLENAKDDALPAELLEALNTLSEAKVETICHRKEGGSSLIARNECLEAEFNTSQTNEDCTQIAETPQDPNPSGLQTLAHQNITSCEPLSNKRNSNSVTNSSDQETACVLRRSSRLEKLKVSRDAKYSDHMYKMPEKILPKILGCEDLTNNNSSAQNFRMQDPALMIDGKEKNMHSARFKNGKQIRKNEQFSGKKEKMKVNKISLGSINRRNIFGENLVYKAALHDDADLVHHCIRKGGNVNQPSYAGWTALHEASVGGFYQTASELLKGGADVNIKGMYQITPLHDAVMNGHYKVAELLLLNGADPLFRNDDGKCALDEAKDLCMKRLLERYIPKHQKCLTSAQRSSIDPLDTDDVYQHKKPKFSSKSHIWHVCNENSNRQKLEHVKVNKGSKESLFINKEEVYEYYQKDPKNTKFGKSKHKQSTLNQIYSTGLRKGNLHNVKDPNTNVPKGIGRRKTQHKRTQVDDVDCNPRKTLAVSPSRRINGLVTYQQHIPETLNDLPEESCEPSSLTLSSLKNGLDNSTEACSVSKEIHIQNLDLSDSQEVQCLELESVDQTEAISFPGLSLHKEIKLPVVTTDKQPHTLQEQHHVLYKSHENSNLVPKDERFNKWENSFLSFVKGNSDNDDGDDDCSTSEKAITSKKVLCSTGGKKHYNFKENLTNEKEMGFQQFLLSEDHLSQENELKAVSLTTLPEQEAVNFSHSDNAVTSEHVANYEQCIFGPSFDHSHGSPEQNSLACMITLSTHEVSKLTNHVELFKKPQDYIPRVPTFLTNQTDTHIVEKVAKNCDTERNYVDRDQKIIYSNEPLSIVVHSQVIETTKVEKRRQNHLESETIHDTDSRSTNNMSKELADISQLSQREKKEISHKPDEELTNNISGDEITIRNCEEIKEKTESEIHMPTNSQEHKTVQNFRKRQSFLKTTCNLGMKTGGINKRNARGESQLHLAARRGNLSLVKALIESGADVNLNDNAGWTPLHEASNEGSIDIIVELLKAGAKVNCENIDGILPLHDAVANNHLKAAEILLQNGANPNQKDQKQKSALDEADDEKMKELLRSYGAIETVNRDESDAIVNEKIPAVRSKRHKQSFCDDGKTIDSSSLSHQERSSKSLSVHQTLSAILQDIEEKQEYLLEFEIRNPEDAEQYIEKMLKIKKIMDNVLAKQKAERDDLAKKYRVSIESFKHGALREQLANLAARQKSLLVVAKKQKKISLKIQNCKNVTSLPCLSLRKLPPRSEISSEKDSQEVTSLENLEHPQSGSLSPVSGSMQETQLSLETWNYSQNTNICLNSEAVRRGEFSGNDMNSKQNVSDCTLDGFPKSRHSYGTEKNKLPSQPVAFIGQTEYSQKENDLTEATDKDHEFYIPSPVIGKLNISETASVLAENAAHPSNTICDQDLSNYVPKRGNRKTSSQQSPTGASESLAHQGIAVLGSETVHQMKPYLKKSVSVVPCADDSQISSASGSGQQDTIKKPLSYSTAPKKKFIQIKDLILLGRINPGNNILEFKTQETTHKASILLNGKLKVESGQIYKNPVTWLKDLLGGNSYVTWNYAWSKVTYLGKELLKYVSEDAPILPEPNSVPQQYQPCLPEVACLDDPVQEPNKSMFEKTKFGQGTSRESMQSIPRYLQINEILLISDQEFLPCHIMDQHWKFCVECEELTL
ncbi:ankyrin repeat domain-containing protein 31 isoform X3 [Symphalangus syndactylus]|uniref:ankyrin repeat domain-containing protein 31 isoform X3 n=1 Tax=Symphalangus syndactylus TaxID=9590 RepID=UPI002440EFEC|nr:ankyrin repeat domain-containing protein 31 isoform X2 [Symphalangus syndactylus]